MKKLEKVKKMKGKPFQSEIKKNKQKKTNKSSPFSLLRCAFLCSQRPPLLHSILPFFALLCSTLACSSLLFLGSPPLCSALLLSLLPYSTQLLFFSARKHSADTHRLRNLYRQHCADTLAYQTCLCQLISANVTSIQVLSAKHLVVACISVHSL